MSIRILLKPEIFNNFLVRDYNEIVKCLDEKFNDARVTMDVDVAPDTENRFVGKLYATFFGFTVMYTISEPILESVNKNSKSILMLRIPQIGKAFSNGNKAFECSCQQKE